MGLFGFFHKIKLYFIRLCEPSLPRATAARNYGTYGEETLARDLKAELPDARIKRNVLVEAPDGNAEIDCMVLYKNKLFAIEVKHWKGRLAETECGFVQHKVDRWTSEIHTKYHKSPFKQLGRAVYLLRQQIPVKAWVNPIVYFADADRVSAEDGRVFFTEIDGLADYIRNGGRETFGGNAAPFFEECTVTDRLYSAAGQKLDCVIPETAFGFDTPYGHLTKKVIASVRITHYRCHDVLTIQTVGGHHCTVRFENGHVRVTVNGKSRRYAFCKLNYIVIGNNQP